MPQDNANRAFLTVCITISADRQDVSDWRERINRSEDSTQEALLMLEAARGLYPMTLSVSSGG